jgi:hypothetical protein
VQHSHGGRIEVVELPAPSPPHERDHGCQRNERSEWDDQVDHAHVAPPAARVRGKVVLNHDASTTVNELAGISTAAMSGVIVPVTASVAPMML